VSQAAPKAGQTTQGPADHIFISYAWEDRVLADWLTLRLTAAGYRVWCDRFKMLGGERFLEQIDTAIKHQTFRMLGLLSRHSLQKPNPVNERTLALAIARERSLDFYIPLDLEGLKPTDLNWMVSSITLVPFTEWADGLQRVLKKLRSLDAPTPLADTGSQAVVDALLPARLFDRLSAMPVRIVYKADASSDAWRSDWPAIPAGDPSSTTRRPLRAGPTESSDRGDP
jgi:hypothetical protein